jgi:hypothetical protein
MNANIRVLGGDGRKKTPFRNGRQEEGLRAQPLQLIEDRHLKVQVPGTVPQRVPFLIGSENV